MPKTPCKGVNKDGTPCKGNGLDRFDGYCFAHAPASETREWRSRGGKNSSTAARADTRIPERLKDVIDALKQGLMDVREGKLDPAAYSAMCRGAKAMDDLYRRADQEMESIRNEEAAAAASEAAGAHGDLAILNTAAQFSAQLNQYRMESLVNQGLATLEPDGNENDPAQYVLTDRGRRRFGLRKLTSYTHEDLDLIKSHLERPVLFHSPAVAALRTLSEMRTALQEAIADLTNGAPPPRDPLTGQILSAPPTGVKIGTAYTEGNIKTKAAIKILKKQLQEAEQLYRVFDVRYKTELGDLRMEPILMNSEEKKEGYEGEDGDNEIKDKDDEDEDENEDHQVEDEEENEDDEEMDED